MRPDEKFTFGASKPLEYIVPKPATTAQDERGYLLGIVASCAFVGAFIVVSLGLGKLWEVWSK